MKKKKILEGEKMSEYSLEDLKKWLKEENEFNAGARIAEEMIVEFEKEQEKPRYSACNADPGRDIESWDVRLYNPKEDSGYTVARFFIEDIPDAEKRARDLCDELNQKPKSLKTISEKFPGLNGKLLEHLAEKESGKIMPNIPPRRGKFQLMVIDDPFRDIAEHQRKVENWVKVLCPERFPHLKRRNIPIQ